MCWVPKDALTSSPSALMKASIAQVKTAVACGVYCDTSDLSWSDQCEAATTTCIFRTNCRWTAAQAVIMSFTSEGNTSTREFPSSNTLWWREKDWLNIMHKLWTHLFNAGTKKCTVLYSKYDVIGSRVYIYITRLNHTLCRSFWYYSEVEPW